LIKTKYEEKNMRQILNPNLSEQDRITLSKLLNGTSEERDQAFNHPSFNILDWTQINNHWRQIPRWVEEKDMPLNKTISNILKKIQKD
jgi:hypothetical protein